MITIRNARPLRAWRLAVWGVICALLLAPLVAMQFATGVAWTAKDFAAAAVLLGFAGLMFEAITRSPLRSMVKLVLLALVVAIVVLVWAQSAVGIF